MLLTKSIGSFVVDFRSFWVCCFFFFFFRGFLLVCEKTGGSMRLLHRQEEDQRYVGLPRSTYWKV